MWLLDEGEVFRLAQTECFHAKDDRCKRGALDLWIGIGSARKIISLGV